MDMTDWTFEDRLHDALVTLTHEHGPQDLTWLTRRARRELRDARVDEDVVSALLDRATLLVQRPDGLVAHLGDVLDGIVLTHRLRGPLGDRNDLWLGTGVQPLLAMAELQPLPLVTGGEARAATTVQPALVGPPGWLPQAGRGDLVALRWSGGALSVTRLEPADLAGPEQENHVRALLAECCNSERWWGSADPIARAGLVVRALGLARLEDPDLLSVPHTPLDELLYDPMEVRAADHWRDFAAARQVASVSFHIASMPAALHMELGRRAGQYGMTTDQFVIALLGHLAWRTPFAEDMEPWDHWDPEWRPKPNLSVLPTRPPQDPGAA